MRIAAAVEGKELSDTIAPHIGAASHILIMDTDSVSFQVKENRIDPSLAQGSGLQTCRNVIEFGAELLITGACGPRAYRKLEASGIRVVPGAGEAAGNMIRRVIDNEHSPSQGPGEIIETTSAETAE